MRQNSISQVKPETSAAAQSRITYVTAADGDWLAEDDPRHSFVAGRSREGAAVCPVSSQITFTSNTSLTPCHAVLPLRSDQSTWTETMTVASTASHSY